MAQYYGSLCGIIRGSIGPLVFSYNKGRQIVYLKLPMDEIATQNMKNSIKMHNAKIFMAFLMKLYTVLLKPQLSKYWKHRILPSNALFVKENILTLHNTIPDKAKLSSENNLFDLSRLQLTYNPKLYEPLVKITSLEYKGAQLKIKWDTKVWREGTPDDIANVFVMYYKPFSPLQNPDSNNITLSDITRKHTLRDIDIKIFHNSAVRKQAEMVIPVEENLNPKFLNVFLFFSNNVSYSQTVGANLHTFHIPLS